jgi:RNA polymerase sigma factor (sigma-70 family)
MNEREKNELVLKYEPLVNKLTKQFVDKVHAPWDDIKSYAYEGLAIAMNTYDSERSNMTFTQFAGFAIRNNILTSLNNELRTVKLSAYAQKKAIENGEAVFNSVSIDFVGADNPTASGYNFTGAPKTSDINKLSVSAKFDDGDVFETLYSKLEDKFSPRDCEIFYMTFGLKDYDVIKGKDIAEHFNISRSSVSIKVNVIISYIRKDEDLMEILSNLLN